MAIIRCKVCGGDLNVLDGTSVAVCEYCGTRQTLPKINDEQRAAAFNRGDHFRKISEFDKALSVYERIIAEDDTDAEAHWCAALSRYGIEYVKDPATGQYIPTCHRASFTSFLEDVDYQAAVVNADPVAREQYEHDGKNIAEVQRNIIETVNKEEPFDVFICYKETDERGQRTPDSALAQDIYYRLTDQGYRVFFSRITLEDKAGQQYEPYIFAALQSAKVMVVIGTRSEYMNAVWVKNEWSRYLALMKNDRNRLLIPCYRDMDPYDMPEQLSVLQSYDMSRIGFIQDLIRGISKVLEADKPKEKETVIVQASSGNTSLDAQIKRGNISLEDGDFKAADNSFDRALDINPECAEAYLGKALAEYQCRNIDDFISLHTETNGRRNKQTISIPRRNDAAIEQSVQKYYIPNYFEANNIRSLYRRDAYSFQSEGKSIHDIIQSEYEYLEHDKFFGRAFICGNDEFKTKLNNAKNMILTGLQTQLNQAKTADDFQYRRILDTYSQEFQACEMSANQKWQVAMQMRESNYQEACAALALVNNIADSDQLIAKFRYIGIDYKDVQERINTLEQLKLQIIQKEENQQLELVKRKKQKKTIAIVLIFATIAVLLFVILVVKPSTKYKEAERLLANGKYDASIAAFHKLGNYRDSKNRVEQVWYEKGKYLLTIGNQIGAFEAFSNSHEYADASKQLSVLSQNLSIVKVSAGEHHTVGLKADGTVVAVGDNDNHQCDVAGWRDIIGVSAGYEHTIGLKSNGTVVATDGVNYLGQLDVGGWRDIIAVSAGGFHSVGLKSNGTVVCVGKKSESLYWGQCEVDGWRDIIAISTGEKHTVGLKADGTVLAVGENFWHGECDVSKWRDIIAIAAGGSHTVGLKADGTVVAVGDNDSGQCNVSEWKDIIAISAGISFTAGLKADGTVVAVGSNYKNQNDVSQWSDIVAISAGGWHAVGLKNKNTVIAVGDNYYGQCDVSAWNQK